MKLKASLASAEVSAGAVAKADQQAGAELCQAQIRQGLTKPAITTRITEVVFH
jgi:hypothetical protein